MFVLYLNGRYVWKKKWPVEQLVLHLERPWNHEECFSTDRWLIDHWAPRPRDLAWEVRADWSMVPQVHELLNACNCLFTQETLIELLCLLDTREYKVLRKESWDSCLQCAHGLKGDRKMYYNFTDTKPRERHELSIEKVQREEWHSFWWLPGHWINSRWGLEASWG